MSPAPAEIGLPSPEAARSDLAPALHVPAPTGAVWLPQGPGPTQNGQVENVAPNNEVVGAIHTLAAHPTNPDILYAGAVNGGIWRTMNATAASPTWTPLTDDLRSLSIGALARRFPEVPIIMDHMGYREWGGEAIEAARDNPNLYLGTTIASFEPSSIAGAVKALGPERVIYGSNGPALYSDLAVTAIKRQKLGKDVEELVLGGNLARLLKLS